MAVDSYDSRPCAKTADDEFDTRHCLAVHRTGLGPAIIRIPQIAAYAIRRSVQQAVRFRHLRAPRQLTLIGVPGVS